MDEYVVQNETLPNGKSLAIPMVEVTQEQTYITEKYYLPNGKILALPVVIVGGGNGSSSPESDPIWIADKPNYSTTTDIETALESTQNALTAGANITIDENDVISSVGDVTKQYVDSNFANVSLALGDKQDKLTAGSNITIDEDDVISANVNLSNYYNQTQINIQSEGIWGRFGSLGSLTLENNQTFNIFNESILYDVRGNNFSVDATYAFEGTGEDRRMKLMPNPKYKYKDVYQIEFRLFSTTPPSEGSGSTRQDIQVDLVSGANDNLISRHVASRNSFVSGAMTVQFTTVLFGENDPMITDGFKLLVQNRSGENLTNLSSVFLIARVNG